MKMTLLAAAFGFAALAAAQGGRSPLKGGATAVVETEAVVDVTKFDRDTRVVTIKGPSGRKLKIKLADDVPNVEEIKAGSKLHVRYVQATALTIAKAGAAVPAVSEETVTLAPRSGAPGQIEVMARDVTGMIVDLDKSRRELTIRTSDGKMTLQVPQGTPGFDEVKVGDTAMIRHAEAVALSAEAHQGGAPGRKY